MTIHYQETSIMSMHLQHELLHQPQPAEAATEIGAELHKPSPGLADAWVGVWLAVGTLGLAGLGFAVAMLFGRA